MNSAVAPAWLTRWATQIALALLVVHYLLAVTSVREKSNTFDEPIHLSQGYLLWKNREHPLLATNGVASQMLGAFPLLFQDIKFPDPHRPPASIDPNWLARTFFYDTGNDLAGMLFSARAAVALLSVALGWLVFVWSRELFGPMGALLSLALYAFFPLALASAPLVATDTAGALGLLLAVYCFQRAVARPRWPEIAACSAALAFAILAKLSAILLAPILGVLALVLLAPRTVPGPASRRGDRLRAIAILGAVGAGVVITTLWLVYNFRFANTGGEEILRTATGPRAIVLRALVASQVVPPAFLEGLCGMLLLTDRAPGFLAGRYSFEGWWWFFPYAFLIKTPLATLALLVTGAVGWFLWRKGDAIRRPAWLAIAPLLVFIVVYGAASLTSRMNIGVRHILPLYPALFILAGANVWWLGRGRVPRVMVGALTLGVVGAGLLAWPHYLASFNLLAGGSVNGYRHLADSSIDWGQDLPGLKRWLDENGRGEPVFLSYFGTAQPEAFGIQAAPLPRHHDWGPQQLFGLQPGLYCISATMVNSVYSPFPGKWCRPYEEAYQQTLALLQKLESFGSDQVARQEFINGVGMREVELALARFRQLRFARLCALLRQREPDAQVGHSMLIYRLSADDVRQAVLGPPAELLEEAPKMERNAPPTR